MSHFHFVENCRYRRPKTLPDLRTWDGEIGRSAISADHVLLVAYFPNLIKRCGIVSIALIYGVFLYLIFIIAGS